MGCASPEPQGHGSADTVDVGTAVSGSTSRVGLQKGMADAPARSRDVRS